MENNRRLMCVAGTGDSEQVKDREAGCVKAEQHFNKNGVIMCSFENVDRKCGHAENITLTEKGDEVTRACGYHSLAEMAVRENAGAVNNQRCLNEDVISNSQDGLCIGGKVDNTYNVENTEIEGQNSNILGTNSVGMNGSKNDSSLLVPSSTDENICAGINVLKMTCSSNVCPLKKESLKQENGQQGGKEDSCINESPPLVHFTTTEDAKNSSGNSLKFSESVCNNSDYLVDKEATFGNGDSSMDKETLKQEKNLKDNIDAPYNDNFHPVDTDPCNDSAHPVDIEPTYSNVHPVDTDPTCNDSLHSVDTDSTCNDSLHSVDMDSTCNDSLHSVDTDSTCNDSLHPVDTDSTCNDSLHPVDTDSTCNDSLHSMDTDPTCNDSLHPVDTESTCNDSLHSVDTDSTCNDSLHPVDTDPTCNDSLHPVDTDPTCNDSLHPVDTDPTCNGNVHVIDNEASRKENVGKGMGDNCINEILQFAPLTANDNAKDSACGEVQISKATSNDHDCVCDVEKETSKRESDQQDGLQINTDDSLSLDLSAGSETTKNCFLQINAEIDGSPSLDLSTAKETQSFSCCESSVSKVNFDNSVCVAMKETSSQEIDQENCVKTNTYTSKSSPLVHLDKDENVQTLATDENNIPKATFNDCVSVKENETLSLANDQQSDLCMSSSPVPLDTNKISETLKCDASSISKDTFCDKSLSMHEESLQNQEMLNQGINKTNSDLQSSIFISCEHSISLEKEDVNLKELDGVGTGDHKVVTDLDRENCSTDIEVDIPESPVTVDKTACSESLAEDLSETLITVNKTVHRGNVEVAISESQIRLSKTVQSTTGDVPELLKTVSNTEHSDSSGEDILEPSITSTKIVQSTTIELYVPESLKTVHSESVVKDIPEMLRIISKTEPFGGIEEDEDGAVQIVDITVDSESVEENLSDSSKTFNKTAQGEDVAGDICESLKKSYKKAMSKKKKRMKEKKGHKKKSKRKQESEKITENLRFVEVSRDVDSAEEVRMGEVVEGRSIIYNRLYDERTLVNTYEELLDQEVENQEIDGLRELEEIDLIKERRKKAKKKKKKSRRRRVATVEEGDVGDNASHRFPTFLDGFFLQYDEGNELDETVEDASVSFDVQARMLNSEERIYPRHFSFESEDSVKSGNCIDSVKNRYEELESRRRKKHDKREHKERKRKKARSNSREARPEREHFMTLTARRQHMFDRERNRSARDEERVRSSGRKIRRIEREMPDKDRRRVEVDEERRHSARSGSQDYRTVIAERSPAHSSQHRQRSESRGVANEMEQERGRGRAKHKDNSDAGRNSQMRGRNAENSHVESSQHRSERGSDKENNRRQRRRQMRTQQSNDLNSRDRISNARREQARRTSVSSSSSISYEGIVRRRGNDSDDSHCIIISQENSDDDGASSDVILVETERIVINLDDEEDAPPSRVRIINRGGRNPAITRKANRKSARPPSELSASLGHSVQSNNSPKRIENVRNKSKRRELPAAPTSDRSTIEVETLSVVASSAAYDPMHPTEEADECNFTHSVFSSSRIPASPIVERGPVSPDSPAPREGRPSTPPLLIVTKAGKTASSMPSQPSAGGVSSNLTSAPAFLTQTQSQQQALMPLPSHLGSEVEQSAHFPSRSLKSSLSPNKQLPNGGLTPGFPAIQQSLFPTQDTVQLLPLQNSRQPLPFNTMIPPFLPPPPPPPFGVCLEADQHLPVPTLNQFSQLASTQPSLEASQLLPVSPMNQFSQHASTQPSLQASQHLQVPTLNQFSQHASLQPNLEASHLVPVSPVNQFSQLASMQLNVEASQHLPVSPMNQFTQLACTQPIMEKHNIDSHRDNQDIFQPVEMVNSLHARVSLQPTLTDKSSLVGSLAADLSSSCSHSSQGHDGGDNVENTKAVDMDFSSEDDDYHLELLSPKANRKDSKRGRQQRQHSNLNQGASSGNSCNPGSSSDLSVKHGKTLRKDANKVASKEHLQVSQDKSKVHRGKKKRVENNVRGEDNYDDVPASAADLTCKEKFLKKLYFQERVIEEVKMAIKPFYSSKKITKEQYKVILRKAVPKVCHNKKGNINPQKILHLVEAYVRKMKGQGSTGGKKRQQVQQRGVEKHSAKDKNASAAVKHNGDRTFGLVR